MQILHFLQGSNFLVQHSNDPFGSKKKRFKAFATCRLRKTKNTRPPTQKKESDGPSLPIFNKNWLHVFHPKPYNHPSRHPKRTAPRAKSCFCEDNLLVCGTQSLWIHGWWTKMFLLEIRETMGTVLFFVDLLVEVSVYEPTWQSFWDIPVPFVFKKRWL